MIRRNPKEWKRKKECREVFISKSLTYCVVGMTILMFSPVLIVGTFSHWISNDKNLKDSFKEFLNYVNWVKQNE